VNKTKRNNTNKANKNDIKRDDQRNSTTNIRIKFLRRLPNDVNLEIDVSSAVASNALVQRMTQLQMRAAVETDDRDRWMACLIG